MESEEILKKRFPRGVSVQIQRNSERELVDVAHMTREELEFFIEIQKLPFRVLIEKAKDLYDMANYIAEMLDIKTEERDKK